MSYEYCTVAYHSREWDHLVEQGWLTHTVSETETGIRFATMIREAR